MEVKAKARYIRMSPRKVRLVIDVVRGMKAEEAVSNLKFMNKLAAEPVLKLLESAMANAEHNFQLKKENLVIKTITADGGPTLHRFKPRAHGRATPIRKRTSHISIILAEIAGKEGDKIKKDVKKKTDTKKKAVSEEKVKDVKKVKSAPKGDQPVKEEKKQTKDNKFDRGALRSKGMSNKSQLPTTKNK